LANPTIKITYLSLDRSLRDRDLDFERLRVVLLRFGGDSDESCFDRCDFFLLFDDFFSLLFDDDETLFLSLEFFVLVDFFDDDVGLRS
jgi:hypothetical protein